MRVDAQTEENHFARSNFVRNLIQYSRKSSTTSFAFPKKVPKKIVQFWDDQSGPPEDVSECMKSWKKMEQEGFEKILFNKYQAREFIGRRLGMRHQLAYDKCYHPAMQSDYFRLCYIFLEGGCYVDTDDVYQGGSIHHLFIDGRLKIQPLCYDVATNAMVSPFNFTKPGANADSWIFYFNNNPLIAGSGHPLIEHALSQATLSLEKNTTNELPEIQSTTGPGNLTRSIFEVVSENIEIDQSLVVLCNWEQIAKSKWELGYRNDFRNWRNSNGRGYP